MLPKYTPSFGLARWSRLRGVAFSLFMTVLGISAEQPEPKVIAQPAALILKSGKTIDGGYLGGDQHTIYLVQDGKYVAVKTADVDTLLFPEQMPKRRAQKTAKAPKAAAKK